MNADLLHALLKCETDIDGAMQRLSGNETLYVSCLKTFLEDTTINRLDEALQTESWDDAFTAAHAIKGLAGNMGFVPLFQSTAEVVVLIRTGKVKEIDEIFDKMLHCYNEIANAIRDNIVDV